MKGLVLAGGKGTRLRPLTYTIAKQVIPVANRPIIHYVMADLEEAGIREVGVVIAPETGDQIKSALRANPWGLDVTYLPQHEPLGLAHAVHVARGFLADEHFVMYLGDNLIGGGIQHLVETFGASGADAAVLLKEVPDLSQFGVAIVDGDGAIQRLVEKPKKPVAGLALLGVYCFSPAVHDAVGRIAPSRRGELEITDAIQYLLDNGGSVIGQTTDAWWLDCGNKEDLLEANRVVLAERLRRDIRGEVDEASRVIGHVVVEEGARIVRSVVQGPAIIGMRAMVKDSSIGPYASVGCDCRVVSSSLERSIVFSGAVIEGVQRIEDSIIGRAAVIRNVSGGDKPLELMVGDETEVLLRCPEETIPAAPRAGNSPGRQ